MSNIKLKATLKAYSKSPFYNDYVRGVNIQSDGTIEQLEPNILYGRRGGKWEKIYDGDMSLISDRLSNIESDAKSQDKLFREFFNNIDIHFNNVDDVIVYKDYLGNVHKWHVEALVDNSTIRYNSSNQLELKYKSDDETIKNQIIFDEDGSWRGIQKAVALKYNKAIKDDNGQFNVVEEIITGKEIVDTQNQTRVELDLLHKELGDITSYVQGDEYQGTALDPICLVNIYNAYDTIESIESHIQLALNDYAIKQLGVENKTYFPNNLKVLETYKGDLWIFTRSENDEDGSWKNNGSDLIVSATNDGVYGVVTGSPWNKSGEYDDSWQSDENYLKGHILSTMVQEGQGEDIVSSMTAPTFNINGLGERLTDIDKTKVEKIDNSNNSFDVAYIQSKGTLGKDQEHNKVDCINIVDGYDANGQVTHQELSIVKRTSNATIIAKEPILDDEVTNIKFINNKLNSIKGGISNLKNTIYTNSFISNNGDITLENNYTTNIKSGI